MDAALGRDGAREQRLASTRRSVEQHALGRKDPETLEDARMLQRQFHDLANTRHLALQPADVFVGNSRSPTTGDLFALDDSNVRSFPDHDGPGRNGPDDLKFTALA